MIEAISEDGIPVDELQDAQPWRMNLVSFCSSDPSKVFIAVGHLIKIFLQSRNGELRYMETLRHHQCQSVINALRTGFVDKDPILVAVDDEGLVRVINMNKEYQTQVLRNNISTWGIATYGPKSLLAVSANSHLITLWDLSSSDDSFGRRVFEGHSNNIPSIDFSPSGEYLVSVSIDASCRLWRVSSGECVSVRQIELFNWSCLAIQSHMVKQIDSLFTPPNNAETVVHSIDYELDDVISDSSSDEYATAETELSSSEDVEQSASKRIRICSHPSDESLDFLVLHTNVEDFRLLGGKSLSVMYHISTLLKEFTDSSRWNMLHRMYRGLDRLSLSLWIPELSVALVASQRSKIAVIRILRNEAQTRFKCLVQHVIPRNSDSPILGMDVVKCLGHPEQDPVFKLMFVTYDLKAFTFKLFGESSPYCTSNIVL